MGDRRSGVDLWRLRGSYLGYHQGEAWKEVGYRTLPLLLPPPPRWMADARCSYQQWTEGCPGGESAQEMSDRCDEMIAKILGRCK